MTKRLVSHDDEKFGSGLPDVVEYGIIDLIRNNSPEQGSSVALVTTEEEFDTFKSEATDGDMAVVDIENRPNAIYIHDGTPDGYVKEFASAISRYEGQTEQNSWASSAKEGDIAIGAINGTTYLTQRGATSSNRHNIQLMGEGVSSGEVTDAITPDEKLGDRVVKTSDDGFLYLPTPTSDSHAAHKKYVDDQTESAEGSSSKANTLVRTNSSGRITAANPTSASHVANKRYVDDQTESAEGHIQNPNTLVRTNSSGRITAANPTSTNHVANKGYVDDQTESSQGHIQNPHTLVRTNSSGYITAGTPTGTGHVANKGYVDNAISGLGIDTFDRHYSAVGSHITNVFASGAKIGKLVILSVSYYGRATLGAYSYMNGAIPSGFRPTYDSEIIETVVDEYDGSEMIVGVVSVERSTGALKMAKRGESGRVHATLTWTTA